MWEALIYLYLLFPFTTLLVTFSPRAISLEHSGGEAGKGMRACNLGLLNLNIFIKSLCETLGRDDISNDVITLSIYFSTFVYICARFCFTLINWWKSDSSVNGEPQGKWRQNSNSTDVVASCPSFSHPAARSLRRAFSQARSLFPSWHNRVVLRYTNRNWLRTIYAHVILIYNTFSFKCGTECSRIL